MQDVAYCTHLRGKVPVAIGLVILIVWTLLGLLSGHPCGRRRRRLLARLRFAGGEPAVIHG